MNKNEYPSPYDISEVCENFIKRAKLSDFLKDRGIFYINSSLDGCIGAMKHILFEKKSIDELREFAYRDYSSANLSGFTIKMEDKFLSIEYVYQNMRDKGNIERMNGYEMRCLTKETIGERTCFKGGLTYTKKTPGRIAFLDKQKMETSFTLSELGEGEWLVEVDGNRSADGKEVQKLFSEILKDKDAKIKVLSIDKLTDSQTIEFFDALSKEGMGTDWNMTDVKSLTFKRGRNVDDDGTNEEETNEGETTVEESVLVGISQAILEGQHLRENEFVKKFEKNGCIFTAMTIEYSSVDTPHTIQLHATFKGNPKIFEVSIVKYTETQGVDGVVTESSLTPQDDLKYRSLFWNNARNIYDKILSNNNAQNEHFNEEGKHV